MSVLSNSSQIFHVAVRSRRSHWIQQVMFQTLAVLWKDIQAVAQTLAVALQQK